MQPATFFDKTNFHGSREKHLVLKAVEQAEGKLSIVPIAHNETVLRNLCRLGRFHDDFDPSGAAMLCSTGLIVAIFVWDLDASEAAGELICGEKALLRPSAASPCTGVAWDAAAQLPRPPPSSRGH